MFLGYQKGKIALVANTREELENNKFMKFDNVLESKEAYELYQGEYLTVTEAKQRKAADKKQALLDIYLKQLSDIDLKVIRSLRAQVAGVATEEDLAKIKEYEALAEEIRIKMRELQQTGEVSL